MTPNDTTQTTPGARTVSISAFYPTREITVDGDDGPVVIPVRVRRLTAKALAAYTYEWEQIPTMPSDRMIYRLPDTTEHEVDDTRNYRIPFDEIKRRRLAEMTPEGRAAYEAQLQIDQAECNSIATRAIADNMQIAPKFRDGAACTVTYTDADGQTLTATSGADLAAMFGGNLAGLMTLAAVVHAENTWPPEKKRRSALLSGSSTGSPTTPPEAGETPVETAAPVAPAVSVAPVAV